MESALLPPERASCRLQLARLLQITGKGTPLITRVLTSTGAVPVRVIRLLLVLKLAGPLTANGALPLAEAICERMLERALAIQPSTEVCGETTLTPLATKALYFASIIGLIRVGSMAKLAISLYARQRARW